jgi:hypothetical protein
MMGQMLNALIGFDIALRAYLNRAGNTAAARELAKAGVALRCVASAQALAEAKNDPKADLQAVLQAAVNAGVSWHELAALVNTMHERNPGSR